MCSKRFCLLLIAIGMPFLVFGQFQGGFGDGFDVAIQNAQTLGNLNITALYQGNDGDGFDLGELSAVTLNNTALADIYAGGNGDGFDVDLFSGLTLDNTSLLAVYSGGNGDGFDVSQFSGITLDNTSLLALYSGGIGDGFDVFQLSGITLDNTQLVALFQGGNGDGFSLGELDNVTLTNLVLSALYSGGNGDGFSAELAVVFLEPNSVCVRPPQLVGTPLTSDMQISSMTNNANVLPEDLNNAFVVLRSKEKGFVITRIANPETAIGTNAVEGMIVYDTDENCIKLYNGTTWNCIIQSCPD